MRLRPLSLTASVVLLDQITKALVVRFVPEGGTAASLLGDFLRIMHVRNTAVAFSLGHSFGVPVKIIGFVLLPLALVCCLIFLTVSEDFSDEFTSGQRWCLAGIAGGGAGNLIDRVFRSLRVVDWISTNNYGWFGMQRFPTYNIADAAVVLSVLAFLVLYLRGRGKE